MGKIDKLPFHDIFYFIFQVDDLAYVWCEWVELELSHEEHEKAITLLRRATAPPPRRISYHDKGETVQIRQRDIN